METNSTPENPQSPFSWRIDYQPRPFEPLAEGQKKEWIKPEMTEMDVSNGVFIGMESSSYYS